MQNEIKKNIQRTNSEGKETGTQVNDLEEKEEINLQLNQDEETRIPKNEERLRNLWDNFINIPTSESQVYQKEKNNRKKLKTYLNKK